MRKWEKLGFLFLFIVATVGVSVGTTSTVKAVVNAGVPVADCSAANPSYQSCLDRGPTTLEIHLADPTVGFPYDYQPDGQGWIEPGDVIVVPQGYCYRIVSITVHVKTSAQLGARNEKIVLRDPTDPDPPDGGNRGRSMGPGINGIKSSDTVDVVYAPNGSQTTQTLAVGNSYNLGGWVPDWCITPDYTIGVDFFGQKPADQFSEFYAIVEWSQQ